MPINKLKSFIRKSRKNKIINTIKKKYNFELDYTKSKFSKNSTVLYISGSSKMFYQFLQWQKPFEVLNSKTNVIIIVRSLSMLNSMLENNIDKIFKIVLIEQLDNLSNFYLKYKPSSILYVNNNQKNFQSLIYNYGYHIHLNHGESEKESMYSNQSKAYDYVLTVGERGIDRYKENLLNFDEKKYISIGRPQLDFIDELKLDIDPNKKVVLYAPTWEGYSESMNYSSVEKFGIQIISKLLDSNKFTVIYKPHPNTGIRLNNIKDADEKIKKLIANNKNAYILSNENIINLFTKIDFAFFDNSSVIIDYLHFNKPAKYLEIQKDEGLRYLIKAFNKFEKNEIKNLIDVVDNEIYNDPSFENRQEIKSYYLGNFNKMESTNKFCNFVIKLSN